MEWLNPGSASYRRPDDPDKTAHYATITDGEIRLKQIPYDRKPQFEKAKEFINTDKMMNRNSGFYVLFWDAKTSENRWDKE